MESESERLILGDVLLQVFIILFSAQLHLLGESVDFGSEQVDLVDVVSGTSITGTKFVLLDLSDSNIEVVVLLDLFVQESIQVFNLIEEFLNLTIIRGLRSDSRLGGLASSLQLLVFVSQLFEFSVLFGVSVIILNLNVLGLDVEVSVFFKLLLELSVLLL